MTHDEIRELLAAYALDAVPETEAEQIKDHLRDCPRCRSELQGYVEAAALMAGVGGAAPEEIWDAIQAEIEGEPSKDLLLHLVGPKAKSEASPSNKRDHRHKYVRRPGIIGGILAGAAAAVVVVLLAVQVVHLNNKVSQLSLALANRNVSALVTAAMTNPHARIIDLHPGKGYSAGAEAVILPNGQGFLLASRLPALAPNRTYQLWAITSGEKISVGVLGNRPSVVAFHLDPSAKLEALAITQQRAGGVVTTSHAPVAWTDVV
jgi:hypothetical protein